MRVVLADGSDFMRRMLGRAFARTPELEVVGESPCGQEVLELVDSLAPDAVVTEVSLATIDGIEMTRRLHQAHPEVRVVGHSSHGPAEKEMLEAGACAFLMKGDAQKLIETLRELA